MAFRALIPLVVAVVFLLTQNVRADEPMREFLLSCAYGTLAGGLVGTATLVLAEDPERQYDNIAKGASLGLYAGILLGTYRVYSDSSPSQYSKRQPQSSKIPPVALLPQWRTDKDTLEFDGLSLHWMALRF